MLASSSGRASPLLQILRVAEIPSDPFANTTLTVLRSVPENASATGITEDAIERAFVARVGWGSSLRGDPR